MNPEDLWGIPGAEPAQPLSDYGVSLLRGVNQVGRTIGGVADLVSNATYQYLPEWMTTPLGYYVDSAMAGEWLDKNQPQYQYQYQYQYNPHGARDALSVDDNRLRAMYSPQFKNNAMHEVLRQTPTVAATVAMSRTPGGVLIDKGRALYSPFAKAATVNAAMGAGYDHSQGEEFSPTQAAVDAVLGGYTKYAPGLRAIPQSVAQNARYGNEAVQGYFNQEGQ